MKKFVYLILILFAGAITYQQVRMAKMARFLDTSHPVKQRTLSTVPMGVGTALNVAFPIINTAIGQVNTNTTAIGTKVGVSDTSTMLTKYARKKSPTFTGTVTLPSTTSIGSVSSSEILALDSPASLSDVSLLKYAVVNAQTGTTYTLQLTDAGNIITMSNGSASALHVPPHTGVALPYGPTTATQITIINKGAGTVTITANSGVTIVSPDGYDLPTGYFAYLIQVTQDIWYLTGHLQ